jgi:HEAT repeat protein
VREGSRNRNLRTPEARSILLAMLGDGDPRVRYWAAAALGATFHRRAVPALVARLRDPDLRVRYRAARSLGMLGDPVAIEPLREMMRVDTWYAGNYARSALRRLGVLRGSTR